MIACGPLPFLDGTVGHTCTFFSNGTSGTALLIIDMLLIKSLASAGNLFSKFLYNSKNPPTALQYL
jgi:hypothetical protein